MLYESIFLQGENPAVHGGHESEALVSQPEISDSGDGRESDN